MKKGNLPKIDKNIWLLAWTSLLNDISSEMIMPILPMFLQSLGAGGIVVAGLGGLRDGLGNILKMFFGYISDSRGRRKPFIVTGYLSSSVCKLLLAVSRSWPWAVVFTLLERIGKGMRNAPRDALIAEYMPHHEGIGFGLHRMMDTTGAILGSLLVLVLYWILRLDFRILIIIAAIIGFLTMIPLVRLKEPQRPYEETQQEAHRTMTLAFSLKKLPRKVQLFILIATIYYLGELNYMLFISRAEFMAFGKYRVLAPLAFYVAFNIFYAALSMPFGILFDRIGGRRTIGLGYLLMAITMLGFVFFKPMFGFLLFALYGIAKASVQGNHIAYVGRMAPEDLKGTAIGTFQTMIGIAMIVGNTVAGIIWEHIGLKWAFVYGFSMIVGALILLLAVWRIMGGLKDESDMHQNTSGSIWKGKKLT